MKGKRPPPLSDLPDFLHNSPYLPTFTPQHSDLIAYRPQPKPTTREILASKPARITIFSLITLTIFLYFRHTIHDYHAWTRLTGPSCALSQPVTIHSNSSLSDERVDWSRLAYTSYATNLDYLCNSLMIFETLHRLDSKPDRLLLYPSTFSSISELSDTPERRLLLKARDSYGVKLMPIEVQHEESASYPGPNWADSYTKLLAFNQTQYSRLLVLDSDSTVLKLMDELFLLPPAAAAMPRAWWLDYPFLTSHIMLIEPSSSSFAQIQESIKNARMGVYDMEIVNILYGRECMTLPHREYALLTGEFRAADHGKWLGRGGEKWDPEIVMKNAKLVHFSDDPLPKPWLASKKLMGNYQPGCVMGREKGTEEDCRARDIWLRLYEDFKERRKNICEV